jgi:hypothetical protein
MKTLSEFIAIANFLGDDMTEEQASQLMDEAKADLSAAEIERLQSNIKSRLYTSCSEYRAECGQF